MSRFFRSFPNEIAYGFSSCVVFAAAAGIAKGTALFDGHVATWILLVAFCVGAGLGCAAGVRKGSRRGGRLLVYNAHIAGLLESLRGLAPNQTSNLATEAVLRVAGTVIASAISSAVVPTLWEEAGDELILVASGADLTIAPGPRIRFCRDSSFIGRALGGQVVSFDAQAEHGRCQASDVMLLQELGLRRVAAWPVPGVEPGLVLVLVSRERSAALDSPEQRYAELLARFLAALWSFGPFDLIEQSRTPEEVPNH